MLIAILLILVGFVLLTISAEYTVMGSVAIANKLKIPTLIIGLTIVAFGTSAPEFVVSIKAALDGSSGIALGNIIGSNIANIALILGITSIIYPVVSKKPLFSFDYIILFSVTLIFALFCLLDKIGMWQGLVFLSIMIIFIFFNYKNAKSETGNEDNEEAISPITKRGWPFVLIVTSLGLAGIVYGAEILVTGAVDLARLLGISETIIGLTIIAVGTSLPELATSVMAAIRRQNDVALGNIVGSNIWNILFIMGTTTTFVDINVDAQLMRYDVWVMLFITTLFLVFIGFLRKIDRRNGILLVVCYILYVVSQVLISNGTFVAR